ncbi:MAG: NAD(P)H-binding protein [Spirochaetales bacterium]
MTIAVFGGTGKTGRLVVQLALAAGHKVKVLARDPDKIPPAFGLEFVAGDALDGGRVMATLTGCEAAVIALGNVKGGPVDVCSRVTDLIVQAASKTGTKTVVAMTSLGVGNSRNDVPWVFRVIGDLFLKKMMDDKAVQEDQLRASALNWVIVRPSGLTDAPATGQALSGTGKMMTSFPQGRTPKGQVTRADVAAFLLATATDGKYARQTWFLSE